MYSVLFESILIGLAIAAPVGPIGMLCIKKTLEIGFIGALLVGLGAAIADSFYGIIAALGLSAVSNFLLSNAYIIRLVGGLFLLYLAYKELNSNPHQKEAKIKSNSKLKLIFDVFILTLTNPMTILTFMGIFASLSTGPVSSIGGMMMVMGIFVGSMCWWCILGILISSIKHRLPKMWLERIKYFSAFILLGFGIFSLYSVIQDF